MIELVERLSHRNDPAENHRLLEGIPWAHRTPPLRALGFSFSLRATDATIGGYLEEILGSFVSPGVDPGALYSFIERPDRPDERYVVYRDGDHVVTTAYASTALRHLLWDVNRLAVEHTPRLLLLHAGAAEHEGRALLLPAEMDAGKTTLVAGLLRAGLRYLTDEAVAIDPESLLIHPYPKPLSIDVNSWGVLSDLRPDLGPALEPFARGQWQVPPEAVRAGAVAPPADPRFVIIPSYVPQSATELAPLPKEEALLAMAGNSFNIDRFGAESGLRILAAVVRQCDCYRMVIGSLEQACGLVLSLLSDERQAAPS